MRMQVKLNDESWTFDEDELELVDAFAIKQATGLTMLDFFRGLSEMDPDALRAMVWFLRRRDGSPVALESINFKLTALNLDEMPDPTEGDATPSESDATA